MVDLDEAHVARADALGEAGEGGQVVDVLQALAHGLEHDREVGEVAGDLEQLRGALALLPQRRPAPGVQPREEERPGGALAEARREQRRVADPAGHELASSAGSNVNSSAPGGSSEVSGMRSDDAVVARHRVRVDAEPLLHAGARGERPRRVHAHAVRRMQHDAPVAELVAEPLDDEVRGVGHDAGRGALVGDEADEVGCRALVEPGCAGACGAGLGRRVRDLGDEAADRLAELRRTPDAVALPERQPPRLAERGGDEHPVVGDLLDAPARGPEREHVADPRLVDHLLVELADAPARDRPRRS